MSTQMEDYIKLWSAKLKTALIARYGHFARVQTPFLLRSDNGLVITIRSYTAMVKSYGLHQEFITPNCTDQNGMVELLIRIAKDQCVIATDSRPCSTPLA